MASKALQKILLALPELELVELQEVKSRVEALLALSGSTQPEAYDDDWLTAGVFAELARRGLVKKQAPNWRQMAVKDYPKRSLAVRQLLLDRMGKTLNQPELYALGHIAARALADQLNAFPGVSVRTMLQQISAVPAALDAAFPGYLEAGMLRLLIKPRIGEEV